MADKFASVGEVGWIFAIAVSCVWCLSYALRSNCSGWILLCVIAAISSAWHHDQWRRFPQRDVVFLQSDVSGLARPTALRGTLLNIPESGPLPDPNSTQASISTLPRGVRSNFHLSITHIRDHTNWRPCSGRVSATVEGHPIGLAAGDFVEAYGMLMRPPSPMNPGERIRGQAERASRILCHLDISYPDCVFAIEQRRSLRSWIGRLRVKGLLLLDRYVGAPCDLLAGTLLLGAKERLERERIDRFFHTGTVHLLSISGLHLGILASCFFFAAKQSRSRRTALVALMVFSIVYCAVTGSRDPVIRAAILVSIVCLGMIWSRQVVAYNALAAAGILVFAIRPASIFQPGTQLSFLAVAAMIWLARNHEERRLTAIESLVARTRPWYQRAINDAAGWGWQLARVGIVIWIVTLPLVMMHFHLVSPAALLLNVMLAFPVFLSLLSGFVVMIVGNLFASLASLAGAICDRSLTFVEVLVGVAHDIPGAYFWTAGPHPIWCSAFYVGLLVILSAAKIPIARRWWCLVWFMLWLAIPATLDCAAAFVSPSKALRCTILAVGHGTCVVLEFPDDRVVLYDCGRMGMPETGVRLVSEFLWHRGISQLDGVILSHADADHYNLLPGILERFRVGEVFVSDRMFQEASQGTNVLRQAIDTARVPLQTLAADDRMRFRAEGSPTDAVTEAVVHVLHPLATASHGSDNANSIVVEVRYQGRTILLPGDVESPGLDEVVAERSRDCDLLLAPHHGSLNPKSAPQAFVAWCTPEWVVISSGRDDDLARRQDAAFSQQGARVLHTSRCGAVTAVIRNGELHVDTFLGSNEP